MAKDAPSLEVSVGGRTVRISNPDRVYFPEPGLTKLDIANYYMSVGDGILRALAERPCMLHRFPNGVGSDKVHQKRLPSGAPAWVETVRVEFPSGRHADELCVTSLASVVWAVQMSTVEFHPWNSRRADVERPDEWRIDLDPMPECDFGSVRQVAGVAKSVLDELGATGWPKTSGGSGLHVYVRIQPRWSFTDVRRAALAFAREVERQIPLHATTVWWRKDRDPRKVFIDYNQNARDHTIASAYSVRGVPRATVSTPIRWDELNEASPQDFTIATVPDRFRALGDVHHAIDDTAFAIDQLLEWADRDERMIRLLPLPRRTTLRSDELAADPQTTRTRDACAKLDSMRPAAEACVPMPPMAEMAMPWDSDIPDPTAALAAARQEHGDTFAVVSGTTTYVFVFSPEGVRNFYALPEDRASKGLADWLLLSRKLPKELFDGRRTLPHELFDREHVASYLEQLDWAIDEQFAELGASGSIDVFAFTRRLGHLLGLGCWAGASAAERHELDHLIAGLDDLDGAAAFVSPGEMGAVAARGKDTERAALATVESVIGELIGRRAAAPRRVPDLFDEIIERWADVGGDERLVGICRDVALVHIASMSNLFAALGWMIVDLIEHPTVLESVRAGDAELAERCALESIRLAQRSIMMRAVLAPVEIADESTVYTVGSGAVIATFLPLTNTSAAPGLTAYDPERWARRRLREEGSLPAREMVTTFGHGRHTCPAQPFSLAAMTRAVIRLTSTYQLTAGYPHPDPVPGQIGGVARSESSCPLHYSRRP